MDELKKYLNDLEDIDRIEKPAAPLPEFPDFPITQEEAGLVDVDAVMFVLSDPVKADLEDFFPNEQSKYNVNDFVSRKLIQLIKLVKADQAYAPDLFGNMLLMKIADAAYADNVENFMALGSDSYLADDQETQPDPDYVTMQEELEHR
ncbi:MAG: hypothetical protein IKF90_20585 [Parasporobacterium sp.]|nr:hypothetical protein [Parasporobacterium sp.]